MTPTVVCFAPDLVEFEFLVNSFWNDMIIGSTVNVWTSFYTQAEFLQYCRNCLRAYSHICFNTMFSNAGFRSESHTKMLSVLDEACLPTFVLDMIREICRPMYMGEDMNMLAYFPLDGTGIGSVPGLGWNSLMASISRTMKLNLFNIAVSLLVKEAPGKSPVFISSDVSTAYSNGSTIKPYRLLAVSKLKHLRTMPTLYFGYQAANTKMGVDVVPVPIQVRKLEFTPVPVITRTNVGPITYKATDTRSIYDASGNAMLYTKFVGGHVSTIHLAPLVVVGGTSYLRSPGDLTGFAYGRLSRTRAHALVAAFNLNDEQLASRDVLRGLFNFGNTFRFDNVETVPFIGSRFPSETHPSQIKDDAPGATAKIGKKKRKKKKKPAAEEENNSDVAPVLQE